MVYGTKGIISCSQPLATTAGLEILRKGGNAGLLYFSRCSGQGCIENMTQPMPLSQHPLLLMSRSPDLVGSEGLLAQTSILIVFNSLHSDAFCLFYDAATKTVKPVKALNGSGRSPAKLTQGHARSRAWPRTYP